LVADLMREQGLRACQPRAYKRTTVPGEKPVTSPDLIGRDFSAPAPEQRFAGDITYLRTGEGWLYLATVVDLATRMVTGWQFASHMRTSRVTDALAMAITHGHIQPGAVFHSGRGAHFAQYCQAHGIHTSVGRTGGWDNAAAESFFSALKNEMNHRQAFPGRARASFAVADYIDVSCNRQRLHSTLGYRTPFEALTGFQAAATGAAVECQVVRPAVCDAARQLDERHPPIGQVWLCCRVGPESHQTLGRGFAHPATARAGTDRPCKPRKSTQADHPDLRSHGER
jgi:putative transposase